MSWLAHWIPSWKREEVLRRAGSMSGLYGSGPSSSSFSATTPGSRTPPGTPLGSPPVPPLPTGPTPITSGSRPPAAAFFGAAGSPPAPPPEVPSFFPPPPKSCWRMTAAVGTNGLWLFSKTSYCRFSSSNLFNSTWFWSCSCWIWASIRAARAAGSSGTAAGFPTGGIPTWGAAGGLAVEPMGGRT